MVGKLPQRLHQPEAYDALFRPARFRKDDPGDGGLQLGDEGAEVGAHGRIFGDQLTGFSAAIKDKERFPEGGAT
jgi:hypothetical protein